MNNTCAIRLRCDFTSGSCWPFGGSAVRPGDASRTLDGLSPQRLDGSWVEPDEESFPIELIFEPYQSLLLRVSAAEGVQFVNIGYRQPEPICLE